MDMNSNFFALSQMLSGLIHIVAVILTIVVGILAFQKVSGTTGKLIGLGAILSAITGLSHYFIQFFLMGIVGMDKVGHFYALNGFFGGIAQLLFLIGIFMLLKNLITTHEDSD